jgi:hypothetical protein
MHPRMVKEEALLPSMLERLHTDLCYRHQRWSRVSISRESNRSRAQGSVDNGRPRVDASRLRSPGSLSQKADYLSEARWVRAQRLHRQVWRPYRGAESSSWPPWRLRSTRTHPRTSDLKPQKDLRRQDLGPTTQTDQQPAPLDWRSKSSLTWKKIAGTGLKQLGESEPSRLVYLRVWRWWRRGLRVPIFRRRWWWHARRAA